MRGPNDWTNDTKERLALRKKAENTGKEEDGMAEKNIYDGKTNIGGIGEIKGAYGPKRAPKGNVVTGGDLRGGKKGRK